MPASERPRGRSSRRLGAGPRIRASKEAEIHVLLRRGFEEGLFGEAEHAWMSRGFRGGHRASELIAPEKESCWLDGTDSARRMKRKIARAYPVPGLRGSIDNIMGYCQRQDHRWSQLRLGSPFEIKGG